MKLEPFIHHTDQFLEHSFSNEFSNQIVVGFTTKNGGVSQNVYESLNLGLHVNDEARAVVANRKNISDMLHFPLESWVCSEQTHNNRIAKITKSHLGAGVLTYDDSIKDTDGLYTSEKNILLALCFADCVPLYFFAPSHEFIGIAHAGWKGTVKDIAGEMVRTWEQEGILPHEIQTVIGPAIDRCCYIVDDYVMNFVNELEHVNSTPFEKISENQYRLDLKELNYQLLRRVGIPPENIQVSSYCTSCENQLFFSHRRDAGKTGRMMSFIGMKED